MPVNELSSIELEAILAVVIREHGPLSISCGELHAVMMQYPRILVDVGAGNIEVKETTNYGRGVDIFGRVVDNASTSTTREDTPLLNDLISRAWANSASSRPILRMEIDRGDK